jgi:hypothetical protein
MPTGSDFALVTDKKLLGVRDFDLWMLKYLSDRTSQAVKRLFIQGAFLERLPLSSPGAGRVRADLKPTELDGMAHDGSGRLLDLEEIDRVAYFPNVNGQTYEVGAAYIEYPVGIRTNPRTGKFEYDHMREGIGVAATPDSVAVGVSTLTFVVDSLFEQGITPGNHAGRQVRVFLSVPGDAATSEAVAIETCTVFYSGGHNKITTTGLLGQTSASATASAYLVQLIGLTVLANGASNRPSQLPESVFFLGTVLGNAGTPVTFDITGQQIIQSQSADFVTVSPLPDWADGTTNPGGTVQASLEKIITDLTSDDLPAWADGTTNPATQLRLQLAKLVTDLTSTTGAGGTGKIYGVDLAGGSPYAMGSSSLVLQLAALQTSLNETAVFNERRSEFEAIRSLEVVYTDVGGGAFRDIATHFNGDDPNDYIVQMLAVGDTNTIARFTPGQQWLSVTPDAAFSAGFNAVAYGAIGFALVGNAGEIQSYISGAMTRRLNGGNILRDVAYKGGTYCAVGDSGDVWTSTNLTAWTQRTGAVGMTTENYLAIETNGTLFVVMTASGKVMTSPDGITWTARASGTVASTTYLSRMLQYSARFGFVALRNTLGGDLGLSHSDDGITWTHQSTKLTGVIPASGFRLALLDRQVAYFYSNGTLFSAIVAEDVAQTPMNNVSGYQNIFHIVDCVPAGGVNVKGTLHVFGQNAAGDAVILTGSPFRPNTIHGV